MEFKHVGARIVCAMTAVAAGAVLLGQMKASGFPDRDKAPPRMPISWPAGAPRSPALSAAEVDIAVSRLGLSPSPVNPPADNFA